MLKIITLSACLIVILSNGIFAQSGATQNGIEGGMNSRDLAAALIDSARENISIDPNLGIEYAKKALEICYSIGHDSLIGVALHEIGKGYYFENNYAAALEYWRIALKKREEIDDILGAVATMNNIGIVYFEISKYESALEYYFRSLKLKEQLGERKAIANTLNNIGSVYNSLGDKEQALDYYYQALNINEDLEDMSGISVNLNNIGGIFRELKRFEEALECYKSALQAEERMESKLGVSSVLSNTGELYYDMGDYEKAMDYYFRSLLLKEQIEDRRGMANLANNLGKLFFETGDYTRAEQFLNRGREMSQEVGAKDFLKNSYNFLYKLAQAQGKYRSALEYHEQLSELKDDMYNEEVSRQVAEMQAVYELEKKDKEIAQLETEKAKHLNTRIYLIFIAISGAVLSLLFLATYLYARRTNRLLADKNRQLENAIRLLRKSERQLKDALADRDKFLSIISHDLRNPLTTLIGTSGFLLIEKDSISKEELARFILNMYRSASSLQGLLENLLDWSLSRTQKIKIEPIVFKLHSAVRDTIGLFELSMDDKEIDYTIDIDSETEVFCDRKLFDTIFRNLISNAVKFSHSGGKIEISSGAENEVIELIVRDNGVGLHAESLSKILKGEDVISSPGTGNEKGTGLGLKLCREFAEKMGGKLYAESRPGEGATFSFTVSTANAADEP